MKIAMEWTLPRFAPVSRPRGRWSGRRHRRKTFAR